LIRYWLTPAPDERFNEKVDDIRHGTQSFIVSFAVACGRVDTISCGDTRNEEDFVSHIKEVVESSISTSSWHFVADNLNIHKSESLVRYVADVSDLDIDLGIKGRSGVLQSIETRESFLIDPSHSIVFHYTPIHASWMNQVEIWFSILVRKLLRRASFASINDLKAKVLAFAEYFNQTMAKPFKWTYRGRALTA
jgi:hypothetical protein